MLSPIQGPDTLIDTQIEELREILTLNESLLEHHIASLETCLSDIPTSTGIQTLLDELTKLAEIPSKPSRHFQHQNLHQHEIENQSTQLQQQIKLQKLQFQQHQQLPLSAGQDFRHLVELSNDLCHQVGPELGNELRESIHECIKAFK